MKENELYRIKQICMRFYLRIKCCPCLNQSCKHCQNDLESLDKCEKVLNCGPLFERYD